MALTEDALVDRVREVCVDLGFVEAVTLDFDRQPEGAADGTFAVRLSGLAPIGRMGFTEEWRGTIQVSILRQMQDDYQECRRSLLQDVRRVRAGIVRDGAETSGEYAVEDPGTTLAIEPVPGGNYLIGRVTVPINAETTL